MSEKVIVVVCKCDACQKQMTRAEIAEMEEDGLRLCASCKDGFFDE